MTEPVAYLNKYLDSSTNITRYKPENQRLLSSNPLYTAEQLHPRVKMTQAEFDELEISLINAQFDYSELKKTIEIVPDMKWFVRSKEPEDDLLDFIFLSGSNLDNLDYLAFDYAKAFDTKEEAELWTNPLTEAVQLPVEGE
ncbi:hypothetical protein [Leuconostoc mesenteroides]|uniref:hypothetical protein n=1 Tax=Leuconostoc mesenteroides TaxID=1245 RepID=UPI00235E56B7|nr:hypothetical protein [Leuconostoc mesenteroides]